MKRTLAAAVFALVMTVAAQAADEFECWWSTIDAGGGVSLGGVFELSGTIGQWDGGPAANDSMSGGTFDLIGGFWCDAAPSCVGDLDGDGAVASPDLAFLLGGWGVPGPADFNGNGAVDAADLAFLLGAWGPCP